MPTRCAGSSRLRRSTDTRSLTGADRGEEHRGTFRGPWHKVEQKLGGVETLSERGWPAVQRSRCCRVRSAAADRPACGQTSSRVDVGASSGRRSARRTEGGVGCGDARGGGGEEEDLIDAAVRDSVAVLSSHSGDPSGSSRDSLGSLRSASSSRRARTGLLATPRSQRALGRDRLRRDRRLGPPERRHGGHGISQGGAREIIPELRGERAARGDS